MAKRQTLSEWLQGGRPGDNRTINVQSESYLFRAVAAVNGQMISREGRGATLLGALTDLAQIMGKTEL